MYTLRGTCYPFIIIYELFRYYMNETFYIVLLVLQLEYNKKTLTCALFICHLPYLKHSAWTMPYYPLHSSDPISFYASMRNVYKLTLQTLACLLRKTGNYLEQFNWNGILLFLFLFFSLLLLSILTSFLILYLFRLS